MKQHVPSRYYKPELFLQRKFYEDNARSYQSLPPQVPVKVQSESSLLEENSEKNDADSFVESFDALTLKSRASVTAIVFYHSNIWIRAV